MSYSIKNLRKINKTRKSKTVSSKIYMRKSKNNTHQRVRRSKNGRIRGGNPNPIHILYAMGNKNQQNQVQAIAISTSIKNLHLTAIDLSENLTFPEHGKKGLINIFQIALEDNMVIDTIELNKSSSTHSWQKVSLPDIHSLIENGTYLWEPINPLLLHYTFDKSSQITGVIGALYSNEVAESDGQIMTEDDKPYYKLNLLENYTPIYYDSELIINGLIIKEDKLTIEKLSFDEYVNKEKKLLKDTVQSENWESEWHGSIITPSVYRVYDLNDILKKCNELNLWSLFNRSLKYYGIKRIIEDQLRVNKKPLFYFIEILRSYNSNDAVESLLNDNEFLLNQFKLDNITLKQFIDYYTDKNIKNYLKPLNYSVRDYKNRGISLKDIFRVTEPKKYSISPSEMIEQGFTLKDLVESKYFEYNTLNWAGFSIMELRNAGCTIKHYMNENKYLEDKDYTALIKAGYTAKEFLEYPHALLGSLKKYFTLKELRNGGCTIKYYMRGRNPDYLQDNDYPALIQAEYTVDEFLKSGHALLYELKKYFTLEQLLQSEQFLLNYSMKDLKYYYSCEELSKIFKLDKLVDVCSIVELNKVYSIIELSKKFTLEQLIPLYSIKDLSTVFSLNDICTKFTLEQLVTVYPLDEIFATGKYKYDDIKKFNNGDIKTLDNLLKDCKKNFMRKTNLECIYDPVKKIATNPTERYPK